jgi:DedD protein
MDRTIKERIIGAIVLVIFVVLVVPIFLDGPPDHDEIVTESVTLPGQSAQKMQTQVLERNRASPVPAQEAADSDADQAAPAQAVKDDPEPRPEPRQEAPKPEPAKVAVADKPAEKDAVPDSEANADARVAKSTTGMWAVQTFASSNQAKAEKLAADLRKQGFLAFVREHSTERGRLYRVRIGPQADRAAAEDVAKKLKAAGHSGQVVTHP